MSNTKHLADLLKVCSILPALAIMPAMADVVTETAAVDNSVSFISKLDGVEVPRDESANGLIRVLNMTEGSYSYDEEKNFMTVAPSDDGKITAQNLFVGIQKQTSDKVAPAIKVEGDENTVLTLTSDKSGVYPLVSRFAKLNIGSEANALGEVNLINNVGGAVMYITDAVTDSNKAGQGHVGNQELNIYANKVLIKTEGTAITGNEGKLTLVANDTLDIIGDIGGYNDVYGGKSHMIMDINNNEGNTAKTTIVGDINAAMGSVLNVGLKGQGSSVTGNMLVSANGKKLPGGGINLHFGDKGTVTGNINAEFEGNVDIDAGDEFVMTGDVSAGNIAVKDDKKTVDVDETKAASAGTIGISGTDDLTINGEVFAATEGSSIDIQGLDIEIESKTDGVLASQKATINVGTEGAEKIEISAVDGRGVRADRGATLNIGNAKTETVDITTGNNYAVMALYQDSKVGISGQSINIANNATGVGAVHAGVNDMLEREYEQLAAVSIEGDNIVITNDAVGGNGVSAMSQGIVDIIGNTTIKADNAILARGKSYVNINTSAEDTVKMLGDINFNYDKATSGSSIDAYIDVTLAGAESFWTGNTVVSYGSGKPEDESLLVVSNAKLTMKDGAVWNATKITDSKEDAKGRYYTALNDLVIDGGTVNIQDTERGIFVDRIVANDATFGGGMLNVNESMDIKSGVTTFGGNATGAALTLASGAKMDIGTSTIKFDTMNIDGTVIASVTNGRPYGHLYGDIVAGENALLKLNVGSVGTYKIFDDEDANMKIDAGLAYVVTNNGLDGIVVETKAIEDLATDAGISTQAAGAIAGLTMTQDPALQKVSLAAQQMLNSGDATMIAMVEKETKKLNPTDKPVAQAAAASVQNQVLSLASGRMSGGVSVGRAGGDEVSQENGFWAQGLFNKSKFADAFHGYTRGVALGADTTIDKKWTVGAGLAFNNSDVHADGVHTDIDSKTLFLYGQYKPNNWFVNATATYTLSDYTDNKTPFGVVWNDSYDVNSYGVALMSGYDFASGITPEAGLRYLHIAQDAHGYAKSLDTDFLSGVAGLKYAFAIENDWAVQLRPELRAAMTYDFISDDASATVVMPGVASYKVDGERLSRMGGEFGIGLTALYKGVEVSLMYDLDLHQDYTSQTGMIKFRGQF